MIDLFPDVTGLFDPQDVKLNRFKSIPAYISVFFFVPVIFSQNSPFAKFHANQGFGLFIIGVIKELLFEFLLPHTLIFTIVGWVISLAVFTLSLVGLCSAAAGKATEIPLICKIRVFK